MRKKEQNKQAPAEAPAKASILLDPRAYVKMTALVNNFAGEVEWHGTVSRLSASSFLIHDILIFPHEASAAAVISDQKVYEDWLNSLDNETFNKNRFHGHSHGKMDAYFSGRDERYIKEKLDQFGKPCAGDDYFYIFLVANRRGDIVSRIYDLTNNAVYQPEDISINIRLDENEDASAFIKRAKQIVKEVAA